MSFHILPCSGKLRHLLLGSGGIRTHAIEMTGTLNQRLRPLGHTTIITHIDSELQKRL